MSRPSRTGRPRPIGHRPWVLALSVVVVAAVVGVLAVLHNSGKPGAAPGSPRPTATSGGSPSSVSHCELQVTNDGFSVRYGEDNAPKRKGDGDIFYGVVVKNPCDRAAVKVQLYINGVVSSYRSSSVDPHGVIIGDPRNIPELLPNHSIGLSGTFSNGGDYDATKVAKLNVRIFSHQWESSRSTPAQQTVRAEHVTIGARNSEGYVPITFKLGMTSELTYGWMSIITLDSQGQVVSGENRSIDTGSGIPGSSVKTSVWVPPDTVDPHPEIFFVTDSYL
jgi:hypothetical protein